MNTNVLRKFSSNYNKEYNWRNLNLNDQDELTDLQIILSGSKKLSFSKIKNFLILFKNNLNNLSSNDENLLAYLYNGMDFKTIDKYKLVDYSIEVTIVKCTDLNDKISYVIKSQDSPSHYNYYVISEIGYNLDNKLKLF